MVSTKPYRHLELLLTEHRREAVTWDDDEMSDWQAEFLSAAEQAIALDPEAEAELPTLSFDANERLALHYPRSRR